MIKIRLGDNLNFSDLIKLEQHTRNVYSSILKYPEIFIPAWCCHSKVRLLLDRKLLYFHFFIFAFLLLNCVYPIDSSREILAYAWFKVLGVSLAFSISMSHPPKLRNSTYV